MEYMILHGFAEYELESLVNAEIKNGWSPLGGVCIRHSKWTAKPPYIDAGESTAFYQAMTRKRVVSNDDWTHSAGTVNPAIPLLEQVEPSLS